MCYINLVHIALEQKSDVIRALTPVAHVYPWTVVEGVCTVDGRNVASKKDRDHVALRLGFLYIFTYFLYYYIFSGAFLYLFDFFDVKLIG